MSLDLAESIELHWLADATGHYQDNLCRAWGDALDNFNYTPHACIEDPAATLSAIVADYPDLHRFDVYAAGTRSQLDVARAIFLAHGLHEARWFSAAVDS
jgi:CDP-4-dehydro-6-deoxyglucose reductase